MIVLNLLATGGIGGIEVLNKSIADDASWENYIAFVFDGGKIEEAISAEKKIVLGKDNKNRLSRNKVVELKKFCISKGVDIIVIHHQNWYLQRIYLKLRKELPNIKYVFMFHHCFDKNNEFGTLPVLKRVKRHYFEKAIVNSDLIISVSQYGKTSYLKYFNHLIPDERVHVVYNGVDSSIIEQGKNNIPQYANTLEIVYIGRLEKIKGVNLLLEALHDLKTDSELNLTIVGDGSERSNLEMMANQIERTNVHVNFTGFQLEKERYLKKANLFIYPSICEEIFGISIVEAMAFGLPCVAFNVGGIPEIVKDNYNGFLAATINKESLIAKIDQSIQALKNDKLSLLCGNAKKTALEYSMQHTCRDLKNEFDAII